MGNLQTRFFIFLFGIVILAVLLLGSFFGGVLYQKGAKDRETHNVTSQVVVDKINDQAFVVSKTVLLDQETQIEIDKGSKWSNFLWGQTINAGGLVRVDVGVDFSKIKATDIKIDQVNKIITIKTQGAEILDASMAGDIKVTSKSGILKFLLENDPNQDHNLAADQLIDEAKKTVTTDDELIKEAEEDSLNVLKLTLQDLGYTVETEEQK